MLGVFRSLRRRWRAARHDRAVKADHQEMLHQALSAEVGRSFGEAAAELRVLTAKRRQTPSEILLRESREHW